MGKKMDLEFTYGLMEENMKVIGKMDIKMDQEFLLIMMRFYKVIG